MKGTGVVCNMIKCKYQFADLCTRGKIEMKNGVCVTKEIMK